jgi:hypothetical protein
LIEFVAVVSVIVDEDSDVILNFCHFGDFVALALALRSVVPIFSLIVLIYPLCHYNIISTQALIITLDNHVSILSFSILFPICCMAFVFRV